MAWIWGWAWLAWAEPTVAPTPSVRLQVILPPGVSAGPVAREMATRPRPSSVTFAVEGRPEARDGRLVVRGVLTNTGSREAAVYVASAGTDGGPFVLRPRGATFRPTGPDPAPAPPRPLPAFPEELVLPPGARVVYESALELGAWEWPATGSEVDWSFAFWTDPVAGTLEGKLSPPR